MTSNARRDGFGHDTTTDEVLQGIDLTGKTALVTGGSSGLGAETARAFASKGAEVILTARDVAKGEGVAEDIRTSTGNPAVDVASLELASLADVRRFAENFLSRHDDIDILVNNAGVMACPPMKTDDGFELQFGTNHLGHFLMTGLLAPALVAGGPTRVVALSSRGHFRSPVRFDDLWFEHDDYDKWTAYGQSKSANILFAIELDRRLADNGVRAFAVHPGVIMTELARHLEAADFEDLQSRSPGRQMRMKTPEAGAATTAYAATAPELDGRGGLYLEDCRVAEVDDRSPDSGVRSYAVDPAAAQRLWTVSEQLVGETFDL